MTQTVRHRDYFLPVVETFRAYRAREYSELALTGVL